MDGYMIHVADRSSVSGNDSKLPGFEGSDSWNNETAHEYLVNQGPFYPATSAYYGYYHTGFETPADWDEQPKVLGFDSQVLQYPASPTESVPYVYYSPNYDYRRSAYNPYNPYIPGANINVEVPFGGSPPYYDDMTYQQSVSSPAYSPISNQTRSEVASSSFTDISNFDTFSYMGEHGMHAEKNYRMPPILREKSSNIYHNKPSLGSRSKSPQTSHISESIQGTDGTTKQSPSMGLDNSFGFPSLRTSYIPQVPTPSTSSMQMNGSTFKVSSVRSTPKFSAPTAHGFIGIGSKSSAWSTADKPNLKFQVASKGNANQYGTLEQNRGPRKNKLTSPISLKAYTTLHDCRNIQGDIYIHPDQYNRDDFQIIHSDAKFFVIKSYSEDDVHKSIKYSVWSSTPNGNKRLGAAFEDAKRRSVGKPGQCPVFLFFSVNASGQFCGVAEMVGPVDFHNDMDFWQQDKWTGSFPVKWHIIKDVPNTSFRRIILENNENKSVTNSRDTQEVPYVQGIEMLHILKDYIFRTSILDDFVFYEERQKAIFEKRSRIRSNGYQFFPKMTVNDKQTAVIDEQSSSVETPPSINGSGNCAEISVPCASNDLGNNVADNLSASSLKINDLSIDGVSETANYKNGFDDGKEIHENAAEVDAFTVGTMTIRISGFDNCCSGLKNNGLNDTSSFITIGTISIDPKVGLNMGNFVLKPSS